MRESKEKFHPRDFSDSSPRKGTFNRELPHQGSFSIPQTKGAQPLVRRISPAHGAMASGPLGSPEVGKLINTATLPLLPNFQALYGWAGARPRPWLWPLSTWVAVLGLVHVPAFPNPHHVQLDHGRTVPHFYCAQLD